MLPNFTFHSAGALIFGRDSVDQLGEVAGRLRAKRILATQPLQGAEVFATNANTVKLAFRRAMERAQCVGLRLHDLRHEATSSLFERTTLRETEIGSVTGHTDLRMLQRYYNKRPAEFVQRFQESFK